MSYSYTVSFKLTSDHPLDLSPLLDAAHSAADTMAQDTSDDWDVCCDFDEASVSVSLHQAARCWSCRAAIYNRIERRVCVEGGRAVPREPGLLTKPVCSRIACSEYSFKAQF